MLRGKLAALLVVAVTLAGSSTGAWAVGRLSAQQPDEAWSVPPTPGTVGAWTPWQSTDSGGVTSYCVSSASTSPWPPITH